VVLPAHVGDLVNQSTPGVRHCLACDSRAQAGLGEGRQVGVRASEALVELLELFRRMVFSWWTGNGDMHLKNFSLPAGADGIHRLSPAHDLLCTRLAIPACSVSRP
jgi:hypothetical protein